MFDIIRKRRQINRQSIDLTVRRGLQQLEINQQKSRKIKSHNASPQVTQDKGTEQQNALNELLCKNVPIKTKTPIVKQNTFNQVASPYARNNKTRPRHRRVSSDQNPGDLLRQSEYRVKKSTVFLKPPRREEQALDQQRTRKRIEQRSSSIVTRNLSESEIDIACATLVKQFNNDTRKMRREKKEIIDYIKGNFEAFNEAPKSIQKFYMLENMLGKGAFGKVVLGTHKLTGKHVAIKLIEKEQLKKSKHNQRKVFQEIYILKKIRHPNIVKIYEVVDSNHHILIVMEYCGGGDLLHFVKRKGRLSETEAKSIFRQIIYGARVTHNHAVLHRDFKLDNILLDKDLTTAKICDFGVSKFVKPDQTIYDQCGTPAYLAPEIVADIGYEGFTVDIWSLGVLLYAMTCGIVPFRGPSIEVLHKLILRGRYNIPGHLSKELVDLLRGMINTLPNNRLTLKQILDHPWFHTNKPEDKIKGPRFVGKPETDLARHSFLDDRVKIDNEIVAQVEEFGFTKDYIKKSLINEDLNHATASYFLLANNSN